MSYGKCQRCEALAQLQPVGTIDPKIGPVVLQLCQQCSPLYLHLNRVQRRHLNKLATHPPKKPKCPPDNATLKRIRAKAQEKKPSQIVLPSEAPPQIVMPEKKGGLILP
jgi:hypothetical protein